MIRGIGTDLVRTSRVEASYDRWGARFARKILTKNELSQFEISSDKAKFLSKRFAAKEAIAKALGTGMRGGVHFTDIEIAHHKSGAPFVVLYQGADVRAKKLDIAQFHLSISDDEGYAIAFAVLEGIDGAID